MFLKFLSQSMAMATLILSAEAFSATKCSDVNLGKSYKWVTEEEGVASPDWIRFDIGFNKKRNNTYQVFFAGDPEMEEAFGTELRVSLKQQETNCFLIMGFPGEEKDQFEILETSPTRIVFDASEDGSIAKVILTEKAVGPKCSDISVSSGDYKLEVEASSESTETTLTVNVKEAAKNKFIYSIDLDGEIIGGTNDFFFSLKQLPMGCYFSIVGDITGSYPGDKTEYLYSVDSSKNNDQFLLTDPGRELKITATKL